MNLKEAQALKADRDYWKNLCKDLSDKDIQQQQEIKRLTGIIERNNLPLHPCNDCGKEERNPGLEVCGECYDKRILRNH